MELDVEPEVTCGFRGSLADMRMVKADLGYAFDAQGMAIEAGCRRFGQFSVVAAEATFRFTLRTRAVARFPGLIHERKAT